MRNLNHPLLSIQSVIGECPKPKAKDATAEVRNFMECITESIHLVSSLEKGGTLEFWYKCKLSEGQQGYYMRAK